MHDDPILYRARAVAERANADAATLDNVRDRCDRAARAWAQMADRAERTLAQRAARGTQGRPVDEDAATPDAGLMIFPLPS